MNPTLTSLFRSLIILQLMTSVIGLVVLMMVKRIFYTAHRMFISSICAGMVIMCAYGAGRMYERMGLPIRWESWMLWSGSALMDFGILGSLIKNRFFASSPSATPHPSTHRGHR